jgi:hypothetical protein
MHSAATFYNLVTARLMRAYRPLLGRDSGLEKI